MEMFDLVDENENYLNKVHPRGVPLSEGEYHFVVEVVTYSKGRLLVTKRHPNKPFGNMWEVTGGSVVAGESIYDGAVRELKEETGIECQKKELVLYSSEVCEEKHSIYKRFILNKSIELKDIKLQEGETIDARLVTYEQWQEMLEEGIVADPIKLRYLKNKDILDAYFESEE